MKQLFLLILACTMLSFSNPKSIKIEYDKNIPEVAFAVGDLTKELTLKSIEINQVP